MRLTALEQNPSLFQVRKWNVTVRLYILWVRHCGSASQTTAGHCDKARLRFQAALLGTWARGWDKLMAHRYGSWAALLWCSGGCRICFMSPQHWGVSSAQPLTNQVLLLPQPSGAPQSSTRLTHMHTYMPFAHVPWNMNPAPGRQSVLSRKWSLFKASLRLLVLST